MSFLIGVVVLAAVLGWLLLPARRRTPDPGEEPEAPDLEELERAEREVRDLGVQQDPEAGFEGDDWGPGTGRAPRR